MVVTIDTFLSKETICLFNKCVKSLNDFKTLMIDVYLLLILLPWIVSCFELCFTLCMFMQLGVFKVKEGKTFQSLRDLLK